ncbi:MAG: hypothetical protein KIT33_07375 [Candidatus Kapabacteria bacterium]|nr:hypothetical protein [Ignavibacteriota bacterium]MCW5884774.1 hypothetical protein [Candidatus Kapabacteria bacterium]
MLIIPSFELENGVCTQCISGEPGTESLYTELQHKPEELIKLLRRENFKALHIIDKDSLIHGKEIDFGLIQKITSAVDIPVELHADFKSLTDCSLAFEAGLYRLVLSNELLADVECCREIIAEFKPSRICFAVIIESGNLYNEKLRNIFSPQELLENLQKSDAKRILIGTNESIYLHSDFDRSIFDIIANNHNIKFTLYGGINTPELLWEINSKKTVNIDSVIIGQAIFSNAFPCQKIWRLIEAELEK